MELWPRARLVCVCRGALASPTGGCGKPFFLIACCAALFAFSVGASAAKLTEQQVKDTCGEKLQSVSYSDGTLSP